MPCRRPFNPGRPYSPGAFSLSPGAFMRRRFLKRIGAFRVRKDTDTRSNRKPAADFRALTAGPCVDGRRRTPLPSDARRPTRAGLFSSPDCGSSRRRPHPDPSTVLRQPKSAPGKPPPGFEGWGVWELQLGGMPRPAAAAIRRRRQFCRQRCAAREIGPAAGEIRRQRGRVPPGGPSRRAAVHSAAEGCLMVEVRADNAR